MSLIVRTWARGDLRGAVDETRSSARTAATLQHKLATDGTPLAARDAFVAGVGKDLWDPLAVSDSDFDVAGITDRLTVDFV